MSPEIGIVIVTYNSEREIGACLDAALATGAEIVVVDNASADGSAAAAARRGVRLIANRSNLGFAAAVNQGFALLRSRCVLLLNPDCIVMGSLDPLARACDADGVAGAGGRLVDEAGRPQAGFAVRRLPTAAVLILESLLLNRFWPDNPINRNYRLSRFDYERRQDVEQPAGAFLMVRRAIWQELGGFDEAFFPLWFEDVDFCRRIIDRGYRLVYVPETTAQHQGAHSISQLSLEHRQLYWYGSLLRYSAKHFRPIALCAVSLAVVAGSWLRMIGDSARKRSFRPVAVYGKVMRLAFRYLFSGSVRNRSAPAAAGPPQT